MMPVRTGSPEYSVYRIASRLKIIWRKMASVATQRMPVPYLTASSGPTIHSPPPIEPARRIAPGPIVRRTFRPVSGSGSGNSPVSQSGRHPWSRASGGLSGGVGSSGPGVANSEGRGPRHAVACIRPRM